jgi:hypothetical protein
MNVADPTATRQIPNRNQAYLCVSGLCKVDVSFGAMLDIA